MTVMKIFEKGKVSIITPCYNGEQFLDRYFDTICKQTFDKVELIVVNDGSSDNSEKIILSWKSRLEDRGYEFRYILQKTRMGAASAINQGLLYVTGEFLIWPDCDDTLMPTSIEKRVRFLNQHPDYAMVRSDYVSVFDKNPEIIAGYGSDWADTKNETIFEDLIFEKTYVTCGCYMVRSSVLFERIPTGEIYWENRGGQNWQLLLPCSYKNKTGYIDEPLYTYFVHSDSHSHRVDGNEYSSHKKRMSQYHEILIHTINDINILSENERTDYLSKINLKCCLQRFDLAIRYDKLEDAKTEMEDLELMNSCPCTRRKILYFFCSFGLSGFFLKVYSLIALFLRKIR